MDSCGQSEHVLFRRLGKRRTMTIPEKIISGAQTGADRAALDAAIDLGIPHGGYCPKGRLAEDGKIPDVYQLKETKSASYPPRTEMNVYHSDATAIFTMAPLHEESGCALTLRLCRKHGKPHILVNLADPSVEEGAAIRLLLAMVKSEEVRVLNVAGSRESSAPGIYTRVKGLIERAFGRGDHAEQADSQAGGPEGLPGRVNDHGRGAEDGASHERDHPGPSSPDPGRAQGGP